MALIKCNECGNEVSDKATACPNCGNPLGQSEKERVEFSNAEETGISAEENEKSAAKMRDTKRVTKIVLFVIAVLIIGGAGLYFLTANSRAYNKAAKEYENKEYKNASEEYEKLGKYKDSAEMLKKSAYKYGEELFNSEKYKEAKAYFEKSKDYKDSQKYVSDCRYKLSVDGKFMMAAYEGLTKRWDIVAKHEKQGNNVEDPKLYEQYCNAELGMIESFYDQKFENENLKNDARAYIDFLKSAKDSLQYFSSDYASYLAKWNEAYIGRAALIKKFMDEYGLKIGDEYQEDLNSIKAGAAVNSIHSVTDSFQLIESTDEWGSMIYKLQMKNTTEYTFEYFYVDIALLDQNGKIVGTGQSQQIYSWKQGQEAEVEAYFNTQNSISGSTIQYTPHYQSGMLFE